MPYHYKGTFLWALASSVSDLVLRQLGEAVHKSPNVLNVFICPKLMMPVWGGFLLEMYDLVVYSPLGGGGGGGGWPSSMHELFVLDFVSPLIPHRPWRIKLTTKVIGLGSTVYFMLWESPGDAGSVLHQFGYSQRGLPPCK